MTGATAASRCGSSSCGCSWYLSICSQGLQGEGADGEALPLDAATEGSARAWFAHQLPRLQASGAPGLLVFEQCSVL